MSNCWFGSRRVCRTYMYLFLRHARDVAALTFDGNEYLRLLTVRFDISKRLVVSTWGPKETPTSIFAGTRDILVMFISPQNGKRDKLRGFFLKLLQLLKIVIIRHKSWACFRLYAYMRHERIVNSWNNLPVDTDFSSP